MEVKNYFATDSQGNVLGSAQVYLYLAGTTTLATGLQSISGAALANPFTSQQNGLVQFKAPDNNYDLRVVKPGREFTIPIQCFDGIAYISSHRYLEKISEFKDFSLAASSVTVVSGNESGVFLPYENQESIQYYGMVMIDALGRRWGRSYSGYIDARWGGAKFDGTSIDTDAIQEPNCS